MADKFKVYLTEYSSFLKTALIEIKSTEHIKEDDLRPLQSIKNDIPNSEAFCLSLDKKPKKINGILCLPWQQGLIELGLHI